MTLGEFTKKYNGKKVDFDNAFGGQCVDLFRFYAKEVLGVQQALPVVGAKDFYANYKKDLNLRNSYKQILNTPEAILQEADIIIWDKWSTNPYGHIAICLSGTINLFESLDQNWDGKGITQKVKHNYLNPKVLGWLRPNKNIDMNFIDLKKKLSDSHWTELSEFTELEKRKLITRDDSIQTQVGNWIKYDDYLSSELSKNVKLIDSLTSKLKASQNEADVLKNDNTKYTRGYDAGVKDSLEANKQAIKEALEKDQLEDDAFANITKQKVAELERKLENKKCKLFELLNLFFKKK